MADEMGSFVGQRARRLARFGGFSSRAGKSRSWWPEEICEKIERIDWLVSGLNEPGESWHEFTAYDGAGRLLGKHRVEGS